MQVFTEYLSTLDTEKMALLQVIPYEQQKLFLQVGCHIPILQLDSGINGTILCAPVHNILCLSRPTGAYEW